MTRRLLAVAALASVGLSACSFGDKQHITDAIVASARAAQTRATATGTLTATVNLVKTRVPPPPGPLRITPLYVQAPVALDLAHAESEVGGTLIFSGGWIYERRTSVKVGVFAASNLMPFLGASNPLPGVVPGSVLTAHGRPWLEFDYAKISRRDTQKTAGSLGIDPGFLLTLLKGTLTGSVKRVGVDGDLTHYKMNVGRDKAERGLGDKAKTTVDRTFRANAISGVVYPAQVWIDREGLPRVVTIKFRQSLGTDTKADLTVSLELTAYGAPVTIAPPGRTEVAAVHSFGQLVHTAIGA